MIRNYVIFSERNNSVKNGAKTRACILQFHSVITNKNLESYISKERRRIEEGKHRGKETLQT